MTQTSEDLYRQLVRAGVEEGGPSGALRQRVRQAALTATDERAKRPVRTSAPDGRTAVVHRRWVRWLPAAAVLVIVTGGLSFFSRAPQPGVPASPWWLGPTAAWAAQVDAAVAQAAIKGITCREQTVFVAADGSTHTSSTWDTFCMSHDSYRRDIYDGSVKRETQWYVPDANGLTVFTSVRFDTRTYSTDGPGTDSFGQHDPVQRMRFFTGLLDKADRRWGPEMIDGRACAGFEIRASQYGSNPDTWVNRIWFDVETMLPARIEMAGLLASDGTGTITIVQDHFDYAPELPADTFVPRVPEGFTPCDHPDILLKVRQAPASE